MFQFSILPFRFILANSQISDLPRPHPLLLFLLFLAYRNIKFWKFHGILTQKVGKYAFVWLKLFYSLCFA